MYFQNKILFPPPATSQESLVMVSALTLTNYCETIILQVFSTVVSFETFGTVSIIQPRDAIDYFFSAVRIKALIISYICAPQLFYKGYTKVLH